MYKLIGVLLAVTLTSTMALAQTPATGSSGAGAGAGGAGGANAAGFFVGPPVFVGAPDVGLGLGTLGAGAGLGLLVTLAFFVAGDGSTTSVTPVSQ